VAGRADAKIVFDLCSDTESEGQQYSKIGRMQW